MAVIPFLKLFETIVEGIYVQACPWLDSIDQIEKYVEMTRISVVTIIYAMLLAFLYVLSKGWGIINFNLDRE